MSIRQHLVGRQDENNGAWMGEIRSHTMIHRAGPVEPLPAIPPRRPDAAAPAEPAPEPKPLAPAGAAEVVPFDPRTQILVWP